MGLKIGISFKENEQNIYEHINKQLSASIYIKQLVINDMNKETEPLKKENNSKKIMDW